MLSSFAKTSRICSISTLVVAWLPKVSSEAKENGVSRSVRCSSEAKETGLSRPARSSEAKEIGLFPWAFRRSSAVTEIGFLRPTWAFFEGKEIANLWRSIFEGKYFFAFWLRLSWRTRSASRRQRYFVFAAWPAKQLVRCSKNKNKFNKLGNWVYCYDYYDNFFIFYLEKK